jgi:hypothetical protein
MIDEDMEYITKECTEEFIVLVADAKLSNTDTIRSPIFTRVEHVEQSCGTKKNKKKDEVQDIKSDEEDNASGDNDSDSPREGEDEAEGRGGEDEEKRRRQSYTT